jgi:peptidyl-prolyl cis-trans isomerase C
MWLFTRSLNTPAESALPSAADSASVRANAPRRSAANLPIVLKRERFMACTRLSVRRAFLMLTFAAFVSAPFGTTMSVSWAQDKDAVVARANGVDIHESDITFAEGEIGSNIPNMPPAQKREYLINYLIDVIVLSQTAEQRKIADRPEVKHLLAFDHNRLLMEALLQEAGKAALSDTAEHAVYDEAIKQAKSEPEVHARHILVPTEEEAKTIVAQLKGGADFATLAKEKSKDPGAADGGDLGYFTKDQMVPEFADAAFKLDKGQISDPVKTQFGWHVIKVEDKRVKPTPTFDQVKPQIENYVAHRAQTELVENLRKSATIERLDKPAAPDPSLNPAAPAKK